MSNSKENDDKSNSLHNNDKVNYPKFEDLEIDIKKFEKELNETGAFNLIYVMKDNDDIKSNNNSNIDIKKDIIEAKSDKANNNFGNTTNLIKLNYDKENINKKGNNNIENDDVEKIKKEVLKIIEKGYFPFFIRAKEFSPIFYCGRPKYPVKLCGEHYLKVNNISKNGCVFCYKDIIIDIDCNLEDLNMEIFGTIEGKEKIYKKDDYIIKTEIFDKNMKNIKFKIKEGKKEGYSPFLIRAEYISIEFVCYGKPEFPINIYIEKFCNENNISKDKYLFFYNDIIINLDSNLKDLNMKMFGVIEAIENNNLI